MQAHTGLKEIRILKSKLDNRIFFKMLEKIRLVIKLIGKNKTKECLVGVIGWSFNKQGINKEIKITVAVIKHFLSMCFHNAIRIKIAKREKPRNPKPLKLEN